MQKFNSQPYKATSSPKFSLPKTTEGKPMSSGGAARSSASAYGKLSKIGGGKTVVPKAKG